MPREATFLESMLAGAAAGLAVDTSLFPIDTLKTRMQAPEGFIKAGGMSGIYKGLGAAAAGSMPGAAMFFATYVKGKSVLEANGVTGAKQHMLAASLGECGACLARVPTENVKQNLQTGRYATTSECVSAIVKQSGPSGFYRGYLTTITREIPFAFIQFPIWEELKARWGASQGEKTGAVQGALCGSFSGAIAAAITTPLDVMKTRLMLDSEKVLYKGFTDCGRKLVAEEGAAVLLSGIQPRVMWISIGGFVFFGVYEKVNEMLTSREEE